MVDAKSQRSRQLLGREPRLPPFLLHLPVKNEKKKKKKHRMDTLT